MLKKNVGAKVLTVAKLRKIEAQGRARRKKEEVARENKARKERRARDAHARSIAPALVKKLLHEVKRVAAIGRNVASIEIEFNCETDREKYRAQLIGEVAKLLLKNKFPEGKSEVRTEIKYEPGCYAGNTKHYYSVSLMVSW